MLTSWVTCYGKKIVFSYSALRLKRGNIEQSTVRVTVFSDMINEIKNRLIPNKSTEIVF